MAAHTDCRSCGSQLAHLRGATGCVSLCPRCGWGTVELTRDERTASPGPELVHVSVGKQDKVVRRQYGR